MNKTSWLSGYVNTLWLLYMSHCNTLALTNHTLELCTYMDTRYYFFYWSVICAACLQGCHVSKGFF